MEFKIFFSSKALNVGNFLKRTISEESSNDKSIATAYEGLGFSYDSLSCKTLSADQCSKSSQDHVLLPWDLPFPELRGHESLYPVRQRSAVPIESSCICSRRDRDQQRTKGKGQRAKDKVFSVKELDFLSCECVQEKIKFAGGVPLSK